MLTLCLTLDTTRKIVKLDEQTATVADLYTEAQRAFAEGDVAAATFESSQQFQLAGGVPRRPLPANSTNLLTSMGIQNQDRIQVTVVQSNNKSKANKKSTPRKRKKQPKEEEESEEEPDVASSATEPRQKSKRQAAQRATDSFAATIAAQNALAKAQATSSNNKYKKKSTSKASYSASLSSPRNPPTLSRPRKFTQTAGRRLQDGETVAPRRPRAPKQSSRNHNTSSDPSEALLATLESKSRAGTLLRQGYKQAVANAYEQNKAVARLAAIPHNVTFQLERQASISNNNDTEDDIQVGTLHVEFSKGVQGRGTFTEQVDYLPYTVLQQVVAAIHPANPQALRPENLALLSPRVLWSLIYHYQQRQEQSEISTGAAAATSSTVTQALRALHPGLDWSFLRRRPTTLSAKARENLRQQQEAEQEQQEAQGQAPPDWEAAAAAIASVEDAMASLHTLERHDRRARALQAVEARSTWQLVTPTEADEDELYACVASHESSRSVWEALGGSSATKVVQRLQTECGIYNWRQLANTTEEELMQKLGLCASNSQYSEAVQAWLLHAQQESVDEIMVEICSGRIDAVEALSENARSATPKDLSSWQWIVADLRQVLVDGHFQSKLDNCPSESDLAEWIRRANQVMTEYPWTAAFVTPIA